MNIISASSLLWCAFSGACFAAIDYEYRGGWDSFSSPSSSGSATELLYETSFKSPLTLVNPSSPGGDLLISSEHHTGIDLHGTLQTPQYETGKGQGQGFMYVMGLNNLTVQTGWQTLASNEFTTATSTWSVAINTSKGLHQTSVQGFWRNQAGVVTTYSLGMVDLSNYLHTTIAFGMQRQTGDGQRVGTFFHVNGTDSMINNSSLIAHNNGVPLGNTQLGIGPQTGQTTNGNQGTFAIDNLYVYNMWTGSSAINSKELEALTEAAHARRLVPETSTASLGLIGACMLILRRRRHAHTNLDC